MACVALAGMFSLNAQNLSYRVEAGANLSGKYVTGGTVPGDHSLKFGFRGGVGLEYALSQKLYLASGLNYRLGGIDSKVSSPRGTMTVKRRERNINLPVNVGSRFQLAKDFALSVEGGPYLAYTFRSEQEVVGVKTSDILDHRKPFELGVGLSVATEFLNRYYLRLGSEFGLTDTQKNRVGSLRKMTGEFYLTAGFRF